MPEFSTIILSLQSSEPMQHFLCIPTNMGPLEQDKEYLMVTECSQSISRILQLLVYSHLEKGRKLLISNTLNSSVLQPCKDAELPDYVIALFLLVTFSLMHSYIKHFHFSLSKGGINKFQCIKKNIKLQQLIAKCKSQQPKDFLQSTNLILIYKVDGSHLHMK